MNNFSGAGEEFLVNNSMEAETFFVNNFSGAGEEFLVNNSMEAETFFAKQR